MSHSCNPKVSLKKIRQIIRKAASEEYFSPGDEKGLHVFLECLEVRMNEMLALIKNFASAKHMQRLTLDRVKVCRLCRYDWGQCREDCVRYQAENFLKGLKK